MHFASYASALPTPPAAAADYSKAAAASLSNIYLNDKYGDCVIAGGYHIVGVETGNAGKLFVATNAQIVKDYSAIGGFDPKNPDATDNGCDEQTALNYWTQHGFANGTKLAGWLAVDGTNWTQVQQALYLFENLFFGVELPDAWITPFPSGNGFTWDVAGAPDPSNGHCFVATGYNQSGVQIDTWGMSGLLTKAAIAKYASTAGSGELYVMLSPDQIAKGQQKAPNGFDWATLVADFDALGGKVPVPTPQPPTPQPPAPTPTPVVAGLTLAQAQKAASDGLAAAWPKH